MMPIENEIEFTREVNNSFYDKYHPQIRAVISRILNYANQSNDIDDCVNIVFLDIMEKLQQYNETRGSMSAFVTVIARSVAINYCRSNMRRTGELIGDEKLDFLTVQIEYHDEAEFNSLVESIILRLSKTENTTMTAQRLNAKPYIQ